VRFRSRGLVHTVGQMWTIDGQGLSNDTCSVAYLRSLSPLNLRGECGEQALQIRGFDDVVVTKEQLTCLTCLVSTS
jgi:hypothetical protein